MSRKEIEDKIAELKSDYVRIQGDAEKLVLVGQSTEKAEQKLIEIEGELADMNRRLEEIKK